MTNNLKLMKTRSSLSLSLSLSLSIPPFLSLSLPSFLSFLHASNCTEKGTLGSLTHSNNLSPTKFQTKRKQHFTNANTVHTLIKHNKNRDYTAAIHKGMYIYSTCICTQSIHTYLLYMIHVHVHAFTYVGSVIVDPQYRFQPHCQHDTCNHPRGSGSRFESSARRRWVLAAG